jgi:hypothetical protein
MTKILLNIPSEKTTFMLGQHYLNESILEIINENNYWINEFIEYFEEAKLRIVKTPPISKVYVYEAFYPMIINFCNENGFIMKDIIVRKDETVIVFELKD